MTGNARIFAIGDIHGCSQALETLLAGLNLTAADHVIVLGDAVDRGPNSCDVLDQILDVRDQCQTTFILGNHEEMLLSALEGQNRDEWMRHGGAATLASYGGRFQDIPKEHLELMKRALDYWEGPNDICVHAGLKPGVELKNQSASWLRWRKLTGEELPHSSGKRVICGHSGIGIAVPLYKNGWVCLDTNAYCGGYLTALELNSGEILQSHENGEFRRGVFLPEIDASY